MQIDMKTMKGKAPNFSSTFFPARRKSPPNSSAFPGPGPIQVLHLVKQSAVPNRESRNKFALWAHFLGDPNLESNGGAKLGRQYLFRRSRSSTWPVASSRFLWLSDGVIQKVAKLAIFKFRGTSWLR